MYRLLVQIVEWVYAKVLHGENWEGEWQKLDRSTVAGIFAIGAEAQPKLRAFADSATEEQLARRYQLTAGSGQTMAGSGRKFLLHVLMHSIRHWAQVAVLLRQQGHATDWQHDFVFCNAID